MRAVPTWTCGSAVTVRSQYTASAFAFQPLRRIFRRVLVPERRRIVETGAAKWTPTRIRYSVRTTDLIDDATRLIGAIIQRFARRTRIVQAGLLRVYLTYAVIAVIVALVVAR